jgi:hypothetical protein
MTAKLEVPFPHVRPPTAGTNLDPPLVRVDPRWEYRELVRDAGGGLPSEAELNLLGAEHWELVGVAPAGTRVHFYFKRELAV